MTIPYIIPHIPKEIFRSKHNQGRENVFDEKISQRQWLEKVIDVWRDEQGSELRDADGQPKLKIETPESGGYFVHHISFPYPEEGYRNDWAVRQAQLSKRIFIQLTQFANTRYLTPAYLGLLLLPRRWKARLLEYWLNAFNNIAELFLNNYCLEPRYYSAAQRELRLGCIAFLEALGVGQAVAEQFALVFVTMLEYDTAYRWRLKDILSESSAELLLANPAKEIKRLMGILAERDSTRPHLVAKFQSLARPLTLLLWLPRIKRAFREAIRAMYFRNLQFTEADRYHVRNMAGGYNFFGLTLVERDAIWPPEQHFYVQVMAPMQGQPAISNGVAQRP